MSKEKNVEKQFYLKLQEPFSNSFIQLKNSIRQFILQKKYNKIINDNGLWISISIAITTAGIELYRYLNQPFWPKKIPLFRYVKKIHASLQPSYLILSIPIISLISAIIEYYIVKLLINKHQKIQRFLLFAITSISNITFLIIYLLIEKQI